MAFTFSAPYLLNIIEMASRQGVQPEALLADIPELENPHALRESESRYPEGVYNNLMESAVDLTGDPWFGLHLGESLNLAAAGLVGQIAQTSSTVGKALENICAFANLGCQALPLRLEQGHDGVALLLEPDAGWLHRCPVAVRHTADFCLAFGVRDLALLTWSDTAASSISLGGTDPYPDDLQEAGRVLGAPLAVGGDRWAMHFPIQILELPVRSADYGLHRILTAYASEKLDKMAPSDSFSEVVRKCLLSMARPALPDASEVAMNLHVGLRTLQRRLRAEGKSFRSLVDEVRLEMATQQLQTTDLQIAEIAYLLGYAEPAAFVRSFKRWTGQTPGLFRTKLRSPVR